jgi:hypothetical protein
MAELLQKLDDRLNDPEFAETVINLLAAYEQRQDKRPDEQTKEQRVRALAWDHGYRIMHPRKNKDLYWVLCESPMTLDDIVNWLT